MKERQTADCQKISEILDKMLYRYWLNQNDLLDSVGNRIRFDKFIEAAKAEMNR